MQVCSPCSTSGVETYRSPGHARNKLVDVIRATRDGGIWRAAVKCWNIRAVLCAGYWTTRGYANSRIANSRTGRLADWSTRGCHRRLCVLSFPFWRHLQDRELSSPRLVQSSPRDVQSASWQSASWRIRELSSYLFTRPCKRRVQCYELPVLCMTSWFRTIYQL